MLRLLPHYSSRPQDLVVQAGLIAVPPIGTAGNDGLPPQPSAVAVTVGVIVAIEERAAGEEEAVVEVVMVMVIPIAIPLHVPVVVGYTVMAHRRTAEVASVRYGSLVAPPPASAADVAAAHAAQMASADLAKWPLGQPPPPIIWPPPPPPPIWPPPLKDRRRPTRRRRPSRAGPCRWCSSR